MPQALRLLLICCFCISFPFGAVAAENGSGQPAATTPDQALRSIQKHTRELLVDQLQHERQLISSLNLTTQERAEIEKAFTPIMETAQAQLAAVNAGRVLSRAQNTELIRKRAQTNQRIAGILGPARMQALQRKLNSPRREFLNFVNALRDNIAALNTSKEQQLKAEPLLKDLTDIAQQIPDEMPQKPSDPAPYAQAVRDAMLKTSTGLKSILKPAQYHEILREMPMLKPEALNAANSASSKPSRDHNK